MIQAIIYLYAAEREQLKNKVPQEFSSLPPFLEYYKGT